MAKENSGTPWPVWAAVMILVALIGAYATMSSKKTSPPPTPTPFPTVVTPTSRSTPIETPASNLPDKYWMDNEPARVIVVTYLKEQEYRVEEPSSPWPWQGTMTVDGGKLVGDAKFRNSLATIKLLGTIREDKSVEIKYRFITDENGNPTDRVNEHVWYPAK